MDTVVFFGASSDMSDLDVSLELVAEPMDGRDDRRHRRGPERADGGLSRGPRQPRTDVVGHVEQQVDVFGTPVPVDDPLEHLLEPRTTLATRRALPARLAREEPHDAP